MDEKKVIEFRVYKLKSGASEAFAERFRDAIGPMLQRHGINVIHFGPSLADPDSFCLVRGYASVEEREVQLAAFYGSREWLEEHDEAVMAMIEGYNSCVIDAAAFYGA
jgi:cytosine/adenosine deaminase-related metal-dependent hydrolase